MHIPMKPNITITVRYILYIHITPQRHPFSLMIHPSFTSPEAITELFPVIIDQCAFSKIISLPLSYTHSVFCVASSISMIILRFTYFVACINNFFSFLSIQWLYHNLFIHSLVDGLFPAFGYNK